MAKLRYVSLFSGIEAVSCALDPDVWEPVAFSEIDPFTCAVLQHHYPNVPNLGDITKIDWTSYVDTIDVVWGGSPCQSFSLAGDRSGLKGALIQDELSATLSTGNTQTLFTDGGGFRA